MDDCVWSRSRGFSWRKHRRLKFLGCQLGFSRYGESAIDFTMSSHIRHFLTMHGSFLNQDQASSIKRSQIGWPPQHSATSCRICVAFQSTCHTERCDESEMIKVCFKSVGWTFRTFVSIISQTTKVAHVQQPIEQLPSLAISYEIMPCHMDL